MNSGAGSGANNGKAIHTKREANIARAINNAAKLRQNMLTGTAPPASAVGTFRLPTMKNIKPMSKMSQGVSVSSSLNAMAATPVALDPAIYLPTPSAPPMSSKTVKRVLGKLNGGKSRKTSRRSTKTRRNKSRRNSKKGTRRH